jgi:hypothetical protein
MGLAGGPISGHIVAVYRAKHPVSQYLSPMTSRCAATIKIMPRETNA